MCGRAGQTLIEAMIAIGLLTIGFLGIVALINRSIGLNRVVSDSYVATYLAAEGIEVTKNLIDANYLQGRPFFTGFSSCVTSPCTRDTGTAWEVAADTDWDAHPPRPDTDRTLYYDPATQEYSYASFGEVTPFVRSIELRASGTSIQVNSIVRWRTRGGGESMINLEDHFYNWYLASAP